MSLPNIIAICAFAFTVVIQLIGIGIFIGQLQGFKEHIKDDIKRLEVKQDRHNNLIERMCVVEQSCKSAHHRLDGYKKGT